jgi:hypothetical protein
LLRIGFSAGHQLPDALGRVVISWRPLSAARRWRSGPPLVGSTGSVSMGAPATMIFHAVFPAKKMDDYRRFR